MSRGMEWRLAPLLVGSRAERTSTKLKTWHKLMHVPKVLGGGCGGWVDGWMREQVSR
jgi:hypothetical protein